MPNAERYCPFGDHVVPVEMFGARTGTAKIQAYCRPCQVQYATIWRRRDRIRQRLELQRARNGH